MYTHVSNSPKLIYIVLCTAFITKLKWFIVFKFKFRFLFRNYAKCFSIRQTKTWLKKRKKKIKINQKQKTHENKCIKLHLKLIKIVDKHLR